MISSEIDFLEKIFGKGQYFHSQKELEIYCCWCFHRKKKLSLNLETHVWKCWVCNRAGHGFIPLIKKVGTYADIKEYIEKFKPKYLKDEAESTEQEPFKISFPKEYIPLVNCCDTLYGKRAYEYLNNRGVSDDEILFYKMGTAFDGRYRGRIILPSFDKEGNLNFFTARSIGKSTFPYINAEVPRGYRKQVVFNELYIDWDKPVVLAEGFFDAIKAKNSIPIFVSSLDQSYTVFQNIVKNQKPVYLALDPDAIKKSQWISELFLGYDMEVYFVDVSPFKDVGEMTSNDFQVRYDNAQFMSKKSLFIDRLRAL